jgi:enterochelin esterase family protein
MNLGDTGFEGDFVKDIAPYVDQHYRTLPGRANRAIAGLSMGGFQTLNIAVSHLDAFAYVGVYSSGLFVRSVPEWERELQVQLDNPSLKEGLKLFWFRTGKDDSLIPNTRNTVEMLRRHGFTITYDESTGGHTWLNWRAYLIDFAPQLFR